MKYDKNYYQVLYIQPDAPTEVIRASYYSLMRDLNIHPDLGGDQTVASLLNEAYETLSNRQKRATYDRKYGSLYGNCRHSSDPAERMGNGTLICRECATELKRMRRKWWMRIFVSTKYYTCPVCDTSVLWLAGVLITI